MDGDMESGPQSLSTWPQRAETPHCAQPWPLLTLWTLGVLYCCQIRVELVRAQVVTQGKLRGNNNVCDDRDSRAV